MAAPAQRIKHGSLVTPVLTEDRLRRSLKSLDEGTLTYMCDRRDVFFPGGVAPGFPGLRIQSVEERSLAGDYECTLNVSGLKTGVSRVISREWRRNPVGWDEASETHVIATGASFAWGTAMADYASMRLMEEGEDEHLDGAWSTRQIVYRGIERTGLVDRQVTVNENIMSPGSEVAVLAPLEGGWTTPETATVSLPRIVVTDTYKSTTTPDTEAIPGPLSAGEILARNLPAVKTFSLSGPDLRRQWPAGWKWASLDPQELYRGAGVWIHREVMEYVWAYTW